MAENENKQPEVKFLNSIAFALNDIDENVRHIQITICQDVQTKEFKAFFDVVDPDKIPKFQD